MSSGAGEFLFAGLSEQCVDLAGDVAFQAADDVAFALAFADASHDVVPGRLVIAHADEDDPIERGVRLAVAATGSTAAATAKRTPVAVRLAGAGLRASCRAARRVRKLVRGSPGRPAL